MDQVSIFFFACLATHFTFQLIYNIQLVLCNSFYSYVYVGLSMGVIGSSVLYFVSVYWDFYAALKSSYTFYTIGSSNGEEQQRQEEEQEPMMLLPAPEDEGHFWIRGALFLCVITLSLFSLAGIALIASYKRCNSRNNKVETCK